MFTLNGAIYVRKPDGFVKCILCKDFEGNYYLYETKVVLKRALVGVQPVTWRELIARYGSQAGDPPVEKEGEK